MYVLNYDVDANLTAARCTVCVCPFCGCLAALSMQRSDPTNEKWQNLIDANICSMERWTASLAWNCEH